MNEAEKTEVLKRLVHGFEVVRAMEQAPAFIEIPALVTLLAMMVVEHSANAQKLDDILKAVLPHVRAAAEEMWAVKVSKPEKMAEVTH